MDMKEAHASPQKCSHPNVSMYVNSKNIPKSVMDKINEIKGESKELLYCGHCNALWVEYRLNQHDYVAERVWFRLIRVEDMRTMKDKWVI